MCEPDSDKRILATAGSALLRQDAHRQIASQALEGFCKKCGYQLSRKAPIFNSCEQLRIRSVTAVTAPLPPIPLPGISTPAHGTAFRASYTENRTSLLLKTQLTCVSLQLQGLLLRCQHTSLCHRLDLPKQEARMQHRVQDLEARAKITIMFINIIMVSITLIPQSRRQQPRPRRHQLNKKKTPGREKEPAQDMVSEALAVNCSTFSSTYT